MARRTSGKFQVSHSEMDVFKTCKRRWFIQYYLGLVKKHQAPRIAADTGTVVHGALEQYYTIGGVHQREMSEPAAIRHVELGHQAALAQELSDDDRKAIDEIYSTADILVRGYVDWVHDTGADSEWTVTGLEERIVIPGPLPDTEIKGYIDIVGEHTPTGDMLVVDTKVAQSFTQVLQTLHISEQGPLYAVMKNMVEGEPRPFRVIWNMIKRNRQTARAKPPYYQRYELVVTHDILVQFYQQLHGQLYDMLETERRLNEGEAHYVVAYPSPTRDCSWKCPYLAVCGAMSDPRSDAEWLLNNNYKRVGDVARISDTVT